MPIRPEAFFQSSAALTAYAITFATFGLDLLSDHVQGKDPSDAPKPQRRRFGRK